MSYVFAFILFLQPGCDEPRAHDDPGRDAAPEPDAASSPDAGSADGGDALPLTQLCTALAERTCAGLMTCACRFDDVPYDAATCVAASTAECVAGWQGRAEPGPLVFDEVRFAECLAAIEGSQSRCDTEAWDPRRIYQACNAFVLLDVPLGGACAADYFGAPCAGGAGACINLVCSALPTQGMPCLGPGLCAIGYACGEGQVCRTPAAAGQPCRGPVSCQVGLVCTTDEVCGDRVGDGAPCQVDEQCGDGLACSGGTCAPRVALGGECRTPVECGEGRTCGPAPETRTCTTEDQLGQPCEAASCGAGLSCGPAGVCVADGVLGGACGSGVACVDGLSCASGKCVTSPGLGAQCAGGSPACAPALACSLEGTCEPVAAAVDGQPCLFDNAADGSMLRRCASGHYCPVLQATCRARGAIGAPCQDNEECAEALVCGPGGTCGPRPGLGMPCAQGRCADGLTCTLSKGAATCTALPKAGQPCRDECGDGLVCKGPGGRCEADFCRVP